MIRPLAPALAVAAAAVASGQDGAGWARVALPSVCRPTPADAAPLEILDGVHLRPPGEGAAGPGPAAPLPAATLVALVEEELRERGLDARVEAFDDALLVHGRPDAVAAAGEWVRALDVLEDALAVEVEATLTPAGGEPRRWRAVLRSGERVGLGHRDYVPYVGDYEVNVASDSGVAEPETFLVQVGETLHVGAARLAGGERILLEAHLDLAQLEELATVDLGTPDLGVLEEPRIGYVDLVFSGVVENGSALVATVSGAPLAGSPDWTLELRATAGAAPAAGAGSPWTFVDLAFLSRPGPPLPSVGLGPGLEHLPLRAPPAPSPVAPGTVARLVTEELAGRGPAPRWTETLLVLPAALDGGGETLGARARALVATFAGALDTATLTARRGALAATLPCAAGRPVRFLAGHEFRRVHDYRAQLAPQSWMPQPNVAGFFHGGGVAGVLEGAGFAGTAWDCRAVDRDTLPRESVGMGALQRVDRSVVTRPVRWPASAGEVVLVATREGPPWTARLALP